MDNYAIQKKEKMLAEKVEDFINSQSPSATAAKFILASLVAIPVITVGAAIPNIFSAFYKPKYKYSKKQVRSALKNLKYRKFIEVVGTKNGKFQVRLTNKGKKRVREFVFEELTIKKPKKWDGKWRILLFDIPTKPETNNNAREALRYKIKELGFYQMQKSVWVCPYECEDEILFIAEIYNVQKYIEIVTADRLLHEKDLKQKFKL